MSDESKDEQASKRRERLKALREKKADGGELESVEPAGRRGGAKRRAGAGVGGRRGELIKTLAQRRKKAKTGRGGGEGDGRKLDEFPKLKAALRKRHGGGDGNTDDDKGGQRPGGARVALLEAKNKELEAQVAELKAELEATRNSKG